MDISVAPHAAQHVAHAAPTIKTILVGVPYMTAAIYSAISFAVGAGLAWYIRGRGLAGVKIDLDNIKMDVANLKAKLSAPTPAAAPAV